MSSGITFCVTYGVRLWVTENLNPATGAPDGVIWFKPGMEFFTLHEPDLQVDIGEVLIQLCMSHDFRDDPKRSDIWRGYVGRKIVERMKPNWNSSEIGLVTRWENLPVTTQSKPGTRAVTIEGIKH
jgi:hypothetical protein